jgi:hypothetical protein
MGTSTNFADLSTIVTSGTPPTFRVQSGVIRDFLVTGNQPTFTKTEFNGQVSMILLLGTPGTKQADYQDLAWIRW